jgi:hypothetical protein
MVLWKEFLHYFLSFRSRPSAIIAISFQPQGRFVAFVTRRSLHPQSRHSYFTGVSAMCPDMSPLIEPTLLTRALLHLGQICTSTYFPSFLSSSRTVIIAGKFSLRISSSLSTVNCRLRFFFLRCSSSNRQILQHGFSRASMKGLCRPIRCGKQPFLRGNSTSYWHETEKELLLERLQVGFSEVWCQNDPLHHFCRMCLFKHFSDVTHRPSFRERFNPDCLI